HLALRAGAQPQVHGVGEVSDVVDAVVRRRVELEQVEEPALGDGDTVLADAARLAVRAEVQAVERLGEDACRRRLARAAGAGEQVGVTDPALPHGVAQRRCHVLLTDEPTEGLGPVLPVEGLVRHRIGLYRERYPAKTDARLPSREVRRER